MDATLGTELAAAGLAPAVSVEPLVFNPNNAATRTVERVQLADGSTIVRKVLQRDAVAPVAHWATSAHSGHWNHWRREVDAYDSGAVAAFEPLLAAPAVLGRVSPEPGVEVLLLEDVQGRSAGNIGLSELLDVAHRLGRAQGALDASAAGIGAGRHAPPGFEGGFASASRGWMWSYSTSRPPGAPGYLDDAAWSHPLVREGFGERAADLRGGYGALMADTPRWRRVMASCPQVFCHLDLWPANLILEDGPLGPHRPPRAEGAPVLVDWSFCGIGAVGEDPANLVFASMLEHLFEPGSFGTLDEGVWAAYSGGLGESGWPHDHRWARLAMCLGVCRYSWLPAAMAANADHEGPTGYAGRTGPPLVEVFERRGRVLGEMLALVDEAAGLAAELGLH